MSERIELDCAHCNAAATIDLAEGQTVYPCPECTYPLPVAPSLIWRYCPHCAKELDWTEDDPHGHCRWCGYVFWRNPTMAVVVAVLAGPRVLMLKRADTAWSGRWHYPGGYIEIGESAREAGERELREETGQTLTLDAQPFGSYTNDHAPTLHVISIVYTTRIPQPFDPILSDEHSDYGWFDLREAPPDEIAIASDLRLFSDLRRLLRESR